MGSTVRTAGRVAALTGTAAAAGIGYASLVERNWFRLRHHTLPLLAPGSPRLRLLHLSDTHLTPRRRALVNWVRGLDAYAPDLVVNTGDALAHPEAVEPFLEALGPLLQRPGAFVYGSNDLFAPRFKNPAQYLWRNSSEDYAERPEPDLPWRELGSRLRESGWLDLNNQTGRIATRSHNVALAGVSDSHIGLDQYDAVAGPADDRADVRLGVLHSPEPANLDRFDADGYQLLLAGHTHGGQLCLPGFGTLVTNCGIDRRRARGLHRYGDAWLDVSAGLGTSPTAPVRFCCRPEASLLDLVATS